MRAEDLADEANVRTRISDDIVGELSHGVAASTLRRADQAKALVVIDCRTPLWTGGRACASARRPRHRGRRSIGCAAALTSRRGGVFWVRTTHKEHCLRRLVGSFEIVGPGCGKAHRRSDRRLARTQLWPSSTCRPGTRSSTNIASAWFLRHPNCRSAACPRLRYGVADHRLALPMSAAIARH